MRMHGHPWLVIALALIAGATACGCEETPADRDADSGDASLPDAHVPDARVPDAQIPDAGSDAAVPPDAIQHSFCNEPFFKLPIDGQSERTSGIAMQGDRIV